MSVWHDLQHRARLAIVYFLLLSSISMSFAVLKPNQVAHPPISPPNRQAAKWKRNGSAKINIPRLYTAYRVLLKDGSEDARIDVSQIGEKSSIADENDAESIKKIIGTYTGKTSEDATAMSSAIIKATQSKDDFDNNSKPTTLPLSLNATDESSPAETKYVHTENSKNMGDDQISKEKSDRSKAAVPGMVIVKMGEPPKPSIDKNHLMSLVTKALSKDTFIHEDSPEQRIAELQQVYKDFLNAWNRPLTETNYENEIYMPKPIGLSALNELMNVVENLKTSNPVDDIVKAINAGMSTEKQSFINANKLAISPTCLSPIALTQNPLDRVRFQKSKIFKRVANDNELNNGGLYETYKKKLDHILQANKEPHKSIKSNIVQKLNELKQCHCDDTKSVVMAINNSGPKVSQEAALCHCDATKPASIAIEGNTVKITGGLTPCTCDTAKGDHIHSAINLCVEDPQVVKSAEPHKEESNENGGLKPYYLANSKHRQMIWNDVPLIRPGSPQKAVVLPKTEGTPSATSADKVADTNIKNHDSYEKKTGSKPKLENATPSLEKNSTRVVLPGKNLTQLQHILKVFQSKHRKFDEKFTVKRGLASGMNGLPNNIAFPEVLVNKLPPEPGTGNKIIDNAGKIFTMSPLDMVQQYSPPILPDVPMQPISTSQTSGHQNPMATANAMPALSNGQQVPSNIMPMLEQILHRLQVIQDNSFLTEVEQPLSFAASTDGAPCELTGSWESLLLGIRINIKYDNKLVASVDRHNRQLWGRCGKRSTEGINDSLPKLLNVTIQETIPPRQHEILENLVDWTFTGYAKQTLGGPISFNCCKMNSNLMGTFVGFCRHCNRIDTIFGSWTFCQPSRDCQDITMSMFDRRDVIRRFSLNTLRREHYKEGVYKKSMFAKKTSEEDNHHAGKQMSVALHPQLNPYAEAKAYTNISIHS